MKKTRYIIKKTKKGYSLYEVGKDADIIVYWNEIGLIKDDAISLSPFKKYITGGSYAPDNLSMDEWIYGMPKKSRKMKIGSMICYNIPRSSETVLNCMFTGYPADIYPHVKIKKGILLQMLGGQERYLLPELDERGGILAKLLEIYGITSITYESGISCYQIIRFLTDANKAFSKISNVLKIAPKDISLDGAFTNMIFRRRKQSDKTFNGYMHGGGNSMTIIAGAGCAYDFYKEIILHEWAHHLDCYLGKKLLPTDRRRIRFLMESKEKAPEYLQQHIQDVVEGDSDSARKFRKELLLRDEEKERAYYSTPIEIFAEATSIYIAESGRRMRNGDEYHSNDSLKKFFDCLHEHKILPLKERNVSDYFINEDKESLLWLAKELSNTLQKRKHSENQYISLHFKNKPDAHENIFIQVNNYSRIGLIYRKIITCLSLFDIKACDVTEIELREINEDSWNWYFKEQYANPEQFDVWRDWDYEFLLDIDECIEKKFGQNSELEQIIYPPEVFGDCENYQEEEYDEISAVKELGVDEFVLYKRAAHALMREGIETVADLLDHSEDEIKAIKGIGISAITDIKEMLDCYGLELAE